MVAVVAIVLVVVTVVVVVIGGGGGGVILHTTNVIVSVVALSAVPLDVGGLAALRGTWVLRMKSFVVVNVQVRCFLGEDNHPLILAAIVATTR